jgi:hypothetical protein
MMKYNLHKYLSVNISILWHIDLLLGNDCETNDTMTIARQWPAFNSGSTVESGFFYVVCSKAYYTTKFSSVTAVQWSKLVYE